MVKTGIRIKKIKRGDVFWVKLDPTIGSETKKTRPVVVISNDIQNDIGVRLIVAPITSNINKIYPFEVLLEIADKQGKAQLDQIRTIDIKRLGEFIISLSYEEVQKIDLSLKLVLSLQ
jgi:mRNA interferase MazF